MSSLVAIVIALSLGGSLPQQGVLVPGESIGGVRLGMTQRQVHAARGLRYGALLRFQCGSCDALIANRGRTQTAIYVSDGKVWGFGLSSAAAPACH